ncbi:MAG: magnesium transporter CorA family protein, partial [Solirubrobacteraceae bacterium]
MEVLTAVDREAISSLLERDEFFWLDLAHPDDAAIEALGALLEFNPLVIEDLRERDQRPKLDPYGDHLLLVVFGVETDPADGIQLLEVEIVISGQFVVTLHERPCAELDDLRKRLAGASRHNEQQVVYNVIDALTDSFFPVLARIDAHIQALEADVLTRPSDHQLHQTTTLSRELVTMTRVATPQRDLFAHAGDQIVALRGLEPAAHNYFRDIHDHLIDIASRLNSQRSLLSTVTNAFFSNASYRLNRTMERLTLVATIFLPLAFVTGFFGQ